MTERQPWLLWQGFVGNREYIGGADAGGGGG